MDMKDRELRKLDEGLLFDVQQALDVGESWKKLMSFIPKNPKSSEIPGRPDFIPKYDDSQIGVVETHAKNISESYAKVLFDEWGTSGQIRPTLNDLKNILVRAQLFRAADAVAEILGEPPPPRPQTGPAAPVIYSVTELLHETTGELNEKQSDTNLIHLSKTSNPCANDPTLQMRSENDRTNGPSQSQGNEEKSEAPLIEFSTKSHNIQGAESNLMKFSEPQIENESDGNIPALSLIMATNQQPSTTSDSTHNSDTAPISTTVDKEHSDNTSHNEESNDDHNSSESKYQITIPNIPLIQGAQNTEIVESRHSFNDSISQSILQDTSFIRFEYNALADMCCHFPNTILQGPSGYVGLIGLGGFGQVYLGIHPKFGNIAIKKIHQSVNERFESDTVKKFINSEIHKFDHKNIVSVLGYSVDGPALCIVSEYIEGGSLEHRISKKVLTAMQRMLIMQGTAEGLRYLHSYKIQDLSSPNSTTGQKHFVHRDVKTANILLTADCIPKLCDFGLAKEYCGQSTTITKMPMGTFAYAAPEASRGTITKKLDIYSYGIVLLELLTGLPVIIQLQDDIKMNIQDFVKKQLKKSPNKYITELLDQSAGEWPRANEIYELSKQCLLEKDDRPSSIQICEFFDKFLKEAC